MMSKTCIVITVQAVLIQAVFGACLPKPNCFPGRIMETVWPAPAWKPAIADLIPGPGYLPGAVLEPTYPAPYYKPAVANILPGPGYYPATVLEPSYPTYLPPTLMPSPVLPAFPAPVLPSYPSLRTAGFEEISVYGQMPVTGPVAVAGALPVTGRMTLGGNVLASGKFSVGCSCGDVFPNYPILY